MLNREIPFLRIIIPLCAGIVSGLYINPGNKFFILFGIPIIGLFLFSLLFNKSQHNNLYGLAISSTLFCYGLFLYTAEKKSLSDLESNRGLYYGELTGYPEEKNNSYKIVLKLHSMESEKKIKPLKGSVLVYLAKETPEMEMLPGDNLKIALKPEMIVNRGNPFEFNYSFYMENLGIKYYAFATPDDIKGQSPPVRRKLVYKSQIIREGIINMYRQRGITDENLALVSAVTLGQKNLLEPEQKEVFIKAGVMHIMAVSGLHTMILCLFITKLLFFLKGRMIPYRILITIILLWAFAFITGLTTSVIRAVLMFSFLETGKLIRRHINNINSVLASAFVLILIRPSVIFSAGFLLSYSAVIYIICFFREFYIRICCKTYFGDKIWQSVLVTTLAQAGTLPLTISLFNRFPTWFILTNIIIIPISSLLIMLGWLIPLTFQLKLLSFYLADALNFITELITRVAGSVSLLPASSIENIGMTTTQSVLLSLVIFSTAFWIGNRKKTPAVIPLTAVLIFTIAGTIGDVIQKRTGELVVYNSITEYAVGIRSGNILYLVCENGDIPDEVRRHCATAGLKINRIGMNGETDGNSRSSEIHNKLNDLYLRTGNSRILICTNLNKNLIKNLNPHYLIVTGQYPTVGGTVNTGGIKNIILTSQASGNFRLPLSDENKKIIRIIKKDGAFTTRL